MTRGLAELTRLATALGANPLTFLGLAGVGDLTLTCTGELSRNRQLGIQLAEGRSAREIVESQQAIAEGYRTAKAVHRLAQREGVEMPIAETMHAILYEDLSVRDAVDQLMNRALKAERA